MKARLLLFLWCIVAVAGCTKSEWCSSKIIIENASSHKIKLVSDKESLPAYMHGKSGIDIELPAGETYDSGWVEGTHYVDLENRIGWRVFATFDDDFEFIYTPNSWGTRSFCKRTDWTETYVSERKYKVIYTFTFTDEDYDSAVAAGAGTGR